MQSVIVGLDKLCQLLLKVKLIAVCEGEGVVVLLIIFRKGTGQ